MGSAEGFGSGGSSGGVVVREVRLHTEGACSSGGRKDEVRAVNISAPSFWNKIPDSELCMETCQTPSLHSGDVSNDHCLRNTSSHSLILDLDAKHVLQKSGKIVRSSSTKRSGVMLSDTNKFLNACTYGPSIQFIVIEKTQMVKQKNSSTCRRGDKRNSKVHKNRCDSFSLKNGLVGFNSAAGGNNFFGIYGLKPDVFDITKYVEELSLGELLHGSCTSPSIAKDKGKKPANSSSNILQSVRKACSLLQDQRGDSSTLDMASSDKPEPALANPKPLISHFDVHSSGESCQSQRQVCLYQPKDILERLALPPPKDLDSLLSDASKTTNSKNCSDPRLGKPASHRTGLPPFPWSQSFSGHNKLGADATKLSTSRTICPGRWVKVKHSTALQKGSADLLHPQLQRFLQPITLMTCNLFLLSCPVFSLVTLYYAIEIFTGRGSASIVVLNANFVLCGQRDFYEHSPTHAAAQTLLDMAAHSSKENPCAAIKLLKKPSQIAMKASASLEGAVAMEHACRSVSVSADVHLLSRNGRFSNVETGSKIQEKTGMGGRMLVKEMTPAAMEGKEANYWDWRRKLAPPLEDTVVTVDEAEEKRAAMGGEKREESDAGRETAMVETICAVGQKTKIINTRKYKIRKDP
ncbi:hypothetical protein BUALT_Bualt05G0051100 [Buddleja alternifolia]|uniref:Uncharacterized protein n=1 Tax=Buddleja alternifolia TaxID=168488 RepID=A0AAV6XGT3_9LAMI|nr:hypothetical protein BUALT_Bualt05G0051100 [Buddleja alternifolia]